MGGNLGEEMHASGFAPSRKCKSNVVGQSSGEGTELTFEKGKTQLGMDIQAISLQHILSNALHHGDIRFHSAL